jgi:hypothetical protein
VNWGKAVLEAPIPVDLVVADDLHDRQGLKTCEILQSARGIEVQYRSMKESESG